MTIARRALLAAPALLAAIPARAQDVPSRPVRIVVPYPPGGVSDITARLIAEPMATSLGQPVPVENRAGADGVIGTEAVAKSAPDGHTLALVSVGHPVNAAFYRLPFDTMRDFTFLTLTTRTPLVIVAARGFAASSPRELVEQFYAVLDSMDDAVLVEPVMAAEDFAEYQQEIPGLFFFLGVQEPTGTAPLHSSHFNFDERVLLTGVETFKRILECESKCTKKK